MFKNVSAILVVLAFGGAGVPSMASAQLIGDKDCFGTLLGSASCPTSFTLPGFQTDGRSLSEATATNGAQQTDFNSAAFAPLPFSFDLKWTGPLGAGAFITYRSWNLVANDGSGYLPHSGNFLTRFNGVLESGFLDFNDRDPNWNCYYNPPCVNPWIKTIATHTVFLTNDQISRANSAGGLVINIARFNGDVQVYQSQTIFDYFELTSLANETVVPEPPTYALMASGLVGIGFAARRRRRSPTG